MIFHVSRVIRENPFNFNAIAHATACFNRNLFEKGRKNIFFIYSYIFKNSYFNIDIFNKTK